MTLPHASPTHEPLSRADALRDRLRSGDLGALPVMVGLLIIVVVFTIMDSAFLSSGNLVFLTLQMAPIGVVSIGIVLVLLLGQIDLSVGSVAGATSALLAVLLVNHGWPLPLAMAATLLMGAGIGAFYGVLFTSVGIPSFIITLAGLLGFLGLQLEILGTEGTINLPAESGLVRFAREEFLPSWFAYLLALAIGAAYAALKIRQTHRRAVAGLAGMPTTEAVARAGLLSSALLVIAWYLGRDPARSTGGVSWMVMLFVALVVVMDSVLRKTRWGRSVFALGGNVEAARRAGLPVTRIYVQVFTLTSLFASVGGLLAAGRLTSVGQQSGGADFNLQAIAAAVIGGTSLFGGRGSAYSALLGILVIFSIQSGLNLQSIQAGPRYMIYGGVTLLAVAVDSLSRRTRASRGSS